VFNYLDSGRLRTGLRAAARSGGDNDPSEIKGLNIELAQLAQDHYQRRILDRSQFAKMRDSLLAQIEQAEAGVGRRQRYPALTRLAGQGKAIRTEWPEASFERRREILLGVIERISVGAARVGRSQFQPERFDISWRL
jgi:hypothetical protein